MLTKQMAPNIPVEAINKMMQQLITDNNQVVLLAGPEKEGVKYPTKRRNHRFIETNEVIRLEAV